MSTVSKTTTTRKVTKTTTTTTTESCESPQITIEKRGDFFNDSFFEDRRQDYQVAVKEVLSKYGSQTSNTDELTNYRDLRTRDLKEENQAVRSTQDDNFHKIVIDVQDFIVGGEVNVKTVDEQRVVIEGHVQKQEGGTTSSKSFMKTFIFSDAEMEEIYSVMSSDGILTVTIPKKQQLQQIVNVERKITTTTQQTQNTSATSSLTGDRNLSITQKGNFFDDSFFEDARQPFQEAVKDVLQKSNEATSQTDVITTYRNLRQRELKDETQAATVSDDQKQHKIIVDVQDFINGGEVIVKTVGEREVVIEGSIKKQEGNKTSSKSFRKSYTLPEDIVCEEVTSVVSADGVLTITAPKKPRALMPGEVNVPLAIQQTDANKLALTANTTNTALQSVNQTSTNQSQLTSQETQQNVTSVQKKVTTVTQQSQVSSDNTSCISSDKSLCITKKGDFFNDSFFEDARKPFQEAVRDVLQKSNITTTQSDEITSYRDLRQRDLKEETQAATVSDETHQQKIIVDVQDFINGGEVIVKTVGEREVLIEGSIKKQEGNTTSSKSFRKRYVLPEDIISESVTSVVSSDGVLTITAPKKPKALLPGEVNIPMAIQQADINKQAVTANTTDTALQSVTQTSTNENQIAAQETQQNVTTVQKKVTTVTQQAQVTSDNTSTVSSDKSLCITKKGDFFNDSFFEDARKPFQEAVRDVLQKSNITTTQTDELTSYRNLRQQDLKEETQAATISDDQQCHKIIVDVQDFIDGGEVVVKTVGEREVLIEGSIKKQVGNTTSSKSFCKRYVLPEDIIVESVDSVVSSDGVLTIIAPRKPKALMPGAVNVPLAIQQSDINKQINISDTTDRALQSVTQTSTNENQVASQETQQNINTMQKKVTTVTQQTQITADNMSNVSSDRSLCITKKGDFFNDSFFEDARKPFQEAVRDVLQKSNVTTTQTDELTSYRNLRQQDLKEETQAATVSDDQQHHKIIVDVQDFIDGGEVVVKTVGEREVVIEGSIKKQEGNTSSSKSFRKRYVLPEDIISESVDSVVSSDGVLTIIAPKKPRASMPGEVNIPLAIQQSDVNKQAIAANTTDTALQTVMSTNENQNVAQETQQNVTTVQKKVMTVTQQTQVTADNTSTVSSDRSLCITKKGDFFNDSFFEDARKPFQEAVRDVLQKSKITTTQTDELTSYRNLRQQDLKEETQAATVSDDQQCHKIIVDVQDFINGGEVVVKTVGEREVVIEGSIKKQEGNTTSSKSFRKRYVLPEDIVSESVNSVVSSDGVLTIIAPKKPKALMPGEISVPLAIQQTDANKQVITTNTTDTAVQSVQRTSTDEKQIASQDIQQNVTSVQKKVSTVTQQKHVTSDNTSCVSSDKSLCITKKGDFFIDSFFEDARKPFQEAVRDVLQKSNITTSQTDELTSYRDLRQRELKEETQAATVSDDNRQHKIIVDVQDFLNGGEVIVKTVGEREIVIEGSIKIQEGNKTSSKSFLKRYILPEDIISESVDSVVSSDGVLTIIAPKKPTALMPGEAQVSVAVQQTNLNKQLDTALNKTDVALHSINQTSTNQTSSASQETQQHVTIQKKVSTVTQQSHVTSDSTSDTSSDRSLCITKKGDFFHDSFFEDARKPFQEAVRDVLQKSNVSSSQTDEITTYRNLRQTDLKEETQAIAISDGQEQHKIIVDVMDFINGGEVTVKTVGEREVVIEGSIKKQEGNKTSSKSFRKRYILPEDIQPDSVTSVVSSDGVLTINAPKKRDVSQQKEHFIPITYQQADVTKQVHLTASGNTVTQSSNQSSISQKEVSVQEKQQNISIEKSVTAVAQQSSNVASERTLIITRKGEFFSDTYFEDARKPFQSAVQDVLLKAKEDTSKTNIIATYRNLRERNLREETQAAAVRDDQQQHKIIVDVKDFITGGTVSVKIVNSREVLIEGKVTKQEGNTTSSKSFRKRYVLPEDIQEESVTSVVSSDGILTVVATKKL
ncbi:hypothetical protein SK128_020018 [Halocaridina rubra]|uniref:SHSP domain-containing protein n=1 Tax=Halocaridina rubra TaxID=373956 RepID=A0AAN8ZXB6_HALRR